MGDNSTVGNVITTASTRTVPQTEGGTIKKTQRDSSCLFCLFYKIFLGICLCVVGWAPWERLPVGRIVEW